MKFAALPLAVAFAIGLAATAQAAFVDAEEFQATTERTPIAAPFDREAWHPCIGLHSGTAHRSCGTATGGPVGGLN